MHFNDDTFNFQVDFKKLLTIRVIKNRKMTKSFVFRENWWKCSHREKWRQEEGKKVVNSILIFNVVCPLEKKNRYEMHFALAIRSSFIKDKHIKTHTHRIYAPSVSSVWVLLVFFSSTKATQCNERWKRMSFPLHLVVDHFHDIYRELWVWRGDVAWYMDEASNGMEIVLIIYHYATNGIHVTDKVQP